MMNAARDAMVRRSHFRGGVEDRQDRAERALVQGAACSEVSPIEPAQQDRDHQRDDDRPDAATAEAVAPNFGVGEELVSIAEADNRATI